MTSREKSDLFLAAYRRTDNRTGSYLVAAAAFLPLLDALCLLQREMNATMHQLAEHMDRVSIPA
jgi:hypothetical protein